ncbi:MAG: hypothetical protein ACYSWU_24765, partial [Planctomycetota bacterium]
MSHGGGAGREQERTGSVQTIVRGASTLNQNASGRYDRKQPPDPCWRRRLPDQPSPGEDGAGDWTFSGGLGCHAGGGGCRNHSSPSRDPG